MRELEDRAPDDSLRKAVISLVGLELEKSPTTPANDPSSYEHFPAFCCVT